VLKKVSKVVILSEAKDLTRIIHERASGFWSAVACHRYLCGCGLPRPPGSASDEVWFAPRSTGSAEASFGASQIRQLTDKAPHSTASPALHE
jgi:hypothetical protein